MVEDGLAVVLLSPSMFSHMQRYMWELAWKAGQRFIFLSANAVPCVGFVELNDLSSHVMWKLVSSLRKVEGESLAGRCGSEDRAQAGC